MPVFSKFGEWPAAGTALVSETLPLSGVALTYASVVDSAAGSTPPQFVSIRVATGPTGTARAFPVASGIVRSDSSTGNSPAGGVTWDGYLRLQSGYPSELIVSMTNRGAAVHRLLITAVTE